jgi:hypothetical protein
VGYQPKTIRAPERGERSVLTAVFCHPCRGLIFPGHTHGFTVGYWLARLRRWDGKQILKTLPTYFHLEKYADLPTSKYGAATISPGRFLIQAMSSDDCSF